MGLFDNDVLEFDTDRLRSQAKRIGTIADNLEKDQQDLTNRIADLRVDWQTGAGSEFFKKYDDKWVKQVSAYVDLLNDLVEALESAAAKYEGLKF